MSPPMTDLDQLRDEILLAALPEVVFDGWSRHALRAAAAAAGHSEADLAVAFPGGVPDLVEQFNDWANRQMAATVAAEIAAADARAAEGDAPLRVRDRIALAVRTRLAVLTPHQEAQRRLISWLALPGNVPLAVRLLYRTVDAIWYAAGDDSADFSWYTKRATLAAVYSPTLLYWLADSSEDFRDTWEFLDRRLADALKLGKATGAARRAISLGGLLPSPVRLARQLQRRRPQFTPRPV